MDLMDIAAWVTVLAGAAVLTACAIVSLVWVVWKVFELAGGVKVMYEWHASYRYYGPAPEPETPRRVVEDEEDTDA